MGLILLSTTSRVITHSETFVSEGSWYMISSINSSRIILALTFLIVGVLVGFFFLILTAQKAKPLTLLRAIGARSGYLIQNLGLQIGAVLVAGTVAALIFLFAATRANATGDVSISVDPAQTAITIAGVAALSLIGGAAAVIRLLRIEPIRATQSGSRSL